MNRLRLALAVFVLFGCGSPTVAPKTLTLATTTSTRDSGLLDELLPAFQKQTGIDVKVVAVGSGQALELGRRGDADVLLTHAPEAEKQFLEEGFGLERRPVTYNDFILVGPQDDPAQVQGTPSIVEAFTKMATNKAAFVSRGDESGTHMKEKAIWKEAATTPEGDWYIESGVGMAEALRLANEKKAYTLTDRATFLSQRQQLQLAILLEGDPLLQNHYAVLLLNPQKHPHLQNEAARKFADYVESPDAREIIRQFGTKSYGQPLFFLLEDE